jgi:AraC family transcriptional regulator of adaptative response / DNA-3-methyladenine glycosylase II
MLDPVECERARVSRNRAYDGRFFTGVRTTGVYCRPVCPVRPARGCNVEFFLSAAAAEVAGYRPCLRCRPETAPFSPAWRGSRTTVDRAMRLIHQGAIDRGGVEDVATRLGVGARHLSRLFQKHVGATPLKVAKTARVQRAKRLIDETDLPLSQIAFRAGFGSVRRFNAVFAEVYNRARSGEVSERRRPAGSKPKSARGGSLAGMGSIGPISDAPLTSVLDPGSSVVEFRYTLAFRSRDWNATTR